jgi:hypothetical protein
LTELREVEYGKDTSVRIDERLFNVLCSTSNNG